jgi:hypothetical protein
MMDAGISKLSLCEHTQMWVVPNHNWQIIQTKMSELWQLQQLGSSSPLTTTPARLFNGRSGTFKKWSIILPMTTKLASNNRSKDRSSYIIHQGIHSPRAGTDSQGPFYASSYCDIFPYQQLKNRLKDHSPSDDIELWISRAKPIVAISIKDATKAIKRTCCHIRLLH